MSAGGLVRAIGRRKLFVFFREVRLFAIVPAVVRAGWSTPERRAGRTVTLVHPSFGQLIIKEMTIVIADDAGFA